MSYTMEQLAKVATQVTRRFVDRPQSAKAWGEYVDVHYGNAMIGSEPGNPFVRKIKTVAELEALFNTKITLQETLMITEF